MKIYFEQSGGLAGTLIAVTLDTNSLPAEDVNRIQNIVDNTKFFDLPPKSPPPKPGAADYFQYKITIETEQQKHTVETTDVTMQSELKPLIAYLRGKAKRR
jgi:hypothetical protein